MAIKKREVDDMTKIINNTTENIMRLYFGVDILHFLMYSKLRVRRTLTS